MVRYGAVGEYGVDMSESTDAVIVKRTKMTRHDLTAQSYQ